MAQRRDSLVVGLAEGVDGPFNRLRSLAQAIPFVLLIPLDPIVPAIPSRFAQVICPLRPHLLSVGCPV
jgi:hypothetical protein